ncbi:Homeobox-leucine zipper protein PROTODERMAL FACTOR 2 [Stylosanthes scabra]|uniref:Homeobox-leucine zipper protein PROTODERMAL FACTOR 2 n=1 Tax=Stylosanthes scabra TaxID=79078 RepID=A0ABU6X8A1_9FABA|nr:Homeobox-leucine zipper protein PROTODERMAL FACTOR 2 [Stylosanthes scabra]
MFPTNVFDSHQQHMMLDMSSSHNESDLGIRTRDEDEFFDIKSATEMMDAPSGDEQDPNQRPKKKGYHRHTQHQIQEMEAFFKQCPHPDDKQRKELSRELGLEPLQVKFWFQNKRTQMKAQHERHENAILKAENEKLRAENSRYKEALSNATCPNCGGPAALGEMSFDEQHLRIENARLKQEIDRISAIAAKYVGKPVTSSSHSHSRSLDLGVGSYGGGAQPSAGGGMVGEMYGGSELLRSLPVPCDSDKPRIVELAVAAMEELTRLAQVGDPLWVQSNQHSTEILNEDEYLRTFPPRGLGPKALGLRSESSRESAVVMMNHTKLVEILMDVNQWSTMFCGIVSRALTLEVLSTGVAGNYNGALQVMSAEFQVASPLVASRENYFVRYCKEHPDGRWAVVDVSLENDNNGKVRGSSRRRPSGCIIEELPNGYSKVTWIEHVEVDDTAVHTIYKPLVKCGLAFGAKRWIATLQRQSERLASYIIGGGAGELCGTSSEGRRSMLKLAERMVMSFCTGVGASTAHAWTTLSSDMDDVRVMTRKSVDDPGRPPGIVLCAATSFSLPLPPNTLFHFLRDQNSRSQWDILSNGGLVQEIAHISTASNSLSLLRVNSVNSSQSNMLILQESCSDCSGSYVVYAPVDMVAMNVVLSGGDPDYVALLPSGFAILPDGLPAASSGGSLLTVAFQILVDSAPTAKLSLGSVTTVNTLIKCTVERIKAAVISDHHHPLISQPS